jgi:hypothetical protein
MIMKKVGSEGPRVGFSRPRKRAATLGLALLACLLSATSPGLAADPAEDELNRQGVEARKREDDAAALEYFRKAYALHHSPRAAAQMGLAEIALGRWADAETHLQEALASPNDPWIQKNQQVLRSSLERVQDQFGTLQILGSPAGAQVVVEGRVVGELPMRKGARVRTGECRFEVRAAGHSNVVRTVTIEAGVPRRETVELSLSATASNMAATQAVQTPRSSLAPPAPPNDESPPPVEAAAPERNHARLRTIGIVLGAAGLVAVGGGVAFGVAARSAAKENSQSNNTFDPNADSSGKQYETLQYVGFGVGAALLVAGTVTFLLGLESDEPQKTARVGIAPLQNGGAALVFAGSL